MSFSLIANRPAKNGFTLIETLVVVAVISILVSATVLTVGLSDNRRFNSEAQRLYTVLQHAADSALMQQRLLGWFYVDGNYQIREFDDKGVWKQCNETVFQTHLLPGIQPLQLTTSEQADDINQPQIVFYNSGEYSPFQIQLQSGDQIISVDGDGLGEIHLVSSRDI